MLVTTSRDKKIRVWDVRQEKPVQEAAGHSGAKNSRAVWLGEHNRFATTGFSRMSERQIGLWEPGRTEPIGGFSMLDSISGVCMPFWGTCILRCLSSPLVGSEVLTGLRRRGIKLPVPCWQRVRTSYFP